MHSPTGPLTAPPPSDDFQFDGADARPTGLVDTARELGDRGMAGVGMVASLNAAFAAFTANPADMNGALDALTDLGGNLESLMQAEPLARLLGAAAGGLLAAQGVRDFMQQVGSLMQEGRAPNASEIAGLVASGLQAIGGALTAIAPFSGPGAPALMGAGALALTASTAASLTQFAIDNWGEIQHWATQAWNDPVGTAQQALQAGTQVVADAAASVQGAIASAWGWLTGSTPPTPQPA